MEANSRGHKGDGVTDKLKKRSYGSGDGGIAVFDGFFLGSQRQGTVGSFGIAR